MSCFKIKELSGNKNHFYNGLKIIFLCTILMVQCKKISPSESNTYELIFEMETTSCMGTCPVQSLKIMSDGFAEYEGTENVENIGEFQGKINQDQLVQLEELMKSISYFEIPAQKNSLVKDLPTKYIFYKKDSLEKRMKYYYPKNGRLDKVIDFSKTIIENTNWKESSKSEQ